MFDSLFSRLAVACALILALAAPSRAETVLRVGGRLTPKTMDIQKNGYLFARLGVTEGLVDVDENVHLTPSLAESWTVSPDHLTWTFKLRQGVRFHDGAPLTAAVARDCLLRLRSVGSLLKPVPLAAIEAPDASTLTIATTRPFAPLAAYLARGEAALFAPSSLDAAGEMIKPVSTGHFAVDTWKIKAEVALTANPAHWSGVQSKVDRVVYKGIPDSMTRVNMLRAGELDIAQTLPADMARSAAATPGIELHTREVARTRMLGFNLGRAPLNDLRVRKALSLAIDRQAIVDHLLDGFGQPAAGLFPPDFHWADAKIGVTPHDPAGAMALLDASGWRDTDGDGVRDRNGAPLTLKLVTYPERAELPLIAEAIQAQLKAVGMDARLTVLPLDAAQQMRADGDFDAYLIGRGLLFVPDPDENLMLDYHSETTGKESLGAFHWSDARVDACLTRASAEFDPARRKALYDEVQETIMRELPVAFLNYYVNVDLTGPGIRGYRMHPLEQRFRLEAVETAR
ncbi:MAG: ABC transporter substrate-binding protein [Pseudodesulfovibrio sp.]